MAPLAQKMSPPSPCPQEPRKMTNAHSSPKPSPLRWARRPMDGNPGRLDKVYRSNASDDGARRRDAPCLVGNSLLRGARMLRSSDRVRSAVKRVVRPIVGIKKNHVGSTDAKKGYCTNLRLNRLRISFFHRNPLTILSESDKITMPC